MLAIATLMVVPGLTAFAAVPARTGPSSSGLASPASLSGAPASSGSRAWFAAPPPPSSTTAAPDLATVAPIDTPGIDPVLDAVSVDPSREIRRADEDLLHATQEQNRTVLRWIQAQHRLTAFASKASGAAQVAAAAAQAHEQARAAQRAAEQELLRRRATERTRRAELAVQQDQLRSIAATLYATAPEDRYAILGTWGDVTQADRRDALRDRALAIQSARVDRAHRPWARAHAARMQQRRNVKRATARTRAAAARALQTADERNRYQQLVDAAEGAARTAIAALGRAQDASRTVLVARRRARLAASVTHLDLPLVALSAYWRAAALAPCRLPWWLLAGVGRAESRHGSGYGGHLTVDGDTAWDRAVGPMQFIPGTWARWATDGNADKKADPHNIYDAAGAAAAYLCFSRGNLDTDAKLRGALLAYNRSIPYATEVLSQGRRYRNAVKIADTPPRPDDPKTPGTGTGGN